MTLNYEWSEHCQVLSSNLCKFACQFLGASLYGKHGHDSQQANVTTRVVCATSAPGPLHLVME